MNKDLKFFKLKFLFKTIKKLNKYFRFKYLIPKTLHSNRVYKFSLGSCTTPYISEIYRNMKTRVSEHQSVSPRIGKPVKVTLLTIVRDYMLIRDHQVAWEEFRILGSKSNKFTLELKQRLFFKRHKSTFNRDQFALESLLF